MAFRHWNSLITNASKTLHPILQAERLNRVVLFSPLDTILSQINPITFVSKTS